MGLISVAKAKELAKMVAERRHSNQIEAGVHVMRVQAVEGKYTNKQRPAAVVTFQDMDMNYDPIIKWVMLDDEGMKSLAIFFGMLKDAFDVDPFAANTLDEFVTKLQKQIGGKKCHVAIRQVERIYEKDPSQWYRNWQSEIWYMGPIDKELRFDEAQAKIFLNPEEEERWRMFQESKGIQTDAPRSNTAASTPAAAKNKEKEDLFDEEEADDMEDKIPSGGKSIKGNEPEKPAAKRGRPTKAEQAAKQAPAATAPSKTAPPKQQKPETSGDDLDDDDWLNK